MSNYDVIIIGAGPGGYVAAIRAAQLGMKIAIIEQEHLGGICLNWGCIPSKSLLRNAEVVSLFKRASEFGVSMDNLNYDFGKAIDRSRQVVKQLTDGVAFLLRKNKIDTIMGSASLIDPHSVIIRPEGRTATATHIIIATGAHPKPMPNLPIDGKRIVGSRNALELREVPRSVVIVGGGATGVEFASIYHAYDSQVSVIEMMPRLLPSEDIDISNELERAFVRKGINVMTSSTVRVVGSNSQGVELAVDTPMGEQKIHCDLVLVAAGVQGNIEGLGLDKVDVEIDRGFVSINERMGTSISSIHAIGDVTGKMLLAHVASSQGIMLVESIAGEEPPEIEYNLMPKATYCYPQVTSFGLTEEEAQKQGYKVSVGKFPFQANGKALALGDQNGFVKIIADASIGEILGAHMIGPEVTEFLPELMMTKLLEGGITELGWLVHSHPTLSETVKEAALQALGKALHI